ncbi:MAG: YcfL family protein [Planctomycetota bacterium]|nr:YcfL family protein [Planctomycetota bacterium]
MAMRSNRRIIWGMARVIFLAVPIVWGTACTSSRAGPGNMLEGGEGVGIEEHYGSSQLKRELEILNPRTERRDGRLVCQFDLHNKKTSQLAFEWTVEWFDASDFKIDWNENWRPMTIGGMGYETLTIHAPTVEARRWRLQVRKPSPVR